MNTATSINIFDLFIFLGVFQGLILAFLLIKKSSKNNRANLYHGLFMLFITLLIAEILITNTGLIVKILPLYGITVPLNFTLAPLIFLHTSSYLDNTKKLKPLYHFIPAILWLLYMILFYIQPNEFKYNLYVLSKHPDWPLIGDLSGRFHDPIGLGRYTNYLTLTHILIYFILVTVTISKKLKTLNQSFFKVENKVLLILRNSILHYIIIAMVYSLSVFYFGINSKVGSYFISCYISLWFFIYSYQIMNDSPLFSYPNSFMSFSPTKYERSSLTESDKERIRLKLLKAIEDEAFHRNNLASLTGLSQKIRENKHHVSQVINENFGKSFFELLAYYRVEDAKRLLLADSEKKMTIEEIAERVGYNSRSSFNTIFKRYTGKTPSVYRNQTE